MIKAIKYSKYRSSKRKENIKIRISFSNGKLQSLNRIAKFIKEAFKLRTKK